MTLQMQHIPPGDLPELIEDSAAYWELRSELAWN